MNYLVFQLLHVLCTTPIFVFIRMLLCIQCFLFPGFCAQLSTVLRLHFSFFLEPSTPVNPLILSITVRGRRFVNMSASSSSSRILCAFRMFCFDIWCTQIVCTSRCSARSRSEIARTLELSAQSSRFCVSGSVLPNSWRRYLPRILS